MSYAATGSATVRKNAAARGKPESNGPLLIGVVVLRHCELAAALATPGEAALNGPRRVRDHAAQRTERHPHAGQDPSRSVITTVWTCRRPGRRVHGYLDPGPAVRCFTDDVRRRQNRIPSWACTAKAEGLPGRHRASDRRCARDRQSAFDVEPRVRDTASHLIAAGP